MHIFIGADHRGFQAKENIKTWLSNQGYQVVDCGNTTYDANDDYPDFTFAVAQNVMRNPDSKGIVICGSGAGVNIAANKVKGIRCSTALNLAEVKQAREHDDLNILSISADHTAPMDIQEMVHIFLNTPFLHEERLIRRLNKIAEYEAHS
jgi:ribose 5-phosphate isomerase B